MDNQEPTEGMVVGAEAPESSKEPQSEMDDSAVKPGTASTEERVEEPKEEESVAAEETTPPKKKAVLYRSNSAPPPEEESSDSLLSQEALKHAKNSPRPEVPDKSTSLSHVSDSLLSQEALVRAKNSPRPEVPDKGSELSYVDPEVGLPRKLSTLSEGEFEEFIKSPRGQNVIVERSPGGRYVRFMEKLGSGASKDVYRAYDTTEGIEVAWNVVTLAGVPKGERNRIVNEVRLLERLHHHNIISFHGSWVNRERQEVNFITEILSSGTLKSFIDKVQVIRWKIAKRWARQILAGLAYLHEQDPPVIHRDLKCDNIFINGTSGDLRIGDLGLSTVHSNGKVLSVLGTPEFMAPDLYEETSYDEKVDIYAFGMALLEIFTKDIPYRECANPAQIYRKVMRGDPPDSLARVRSKEARDFITLCLGYKDEETGNYVRPSAAELLNHPFLGAGADDESVVEIDPPLRPIREEGGESEPRRKGVTTKIEVPAPPSRKDSEASEMPVESNAASQQVSSPVQASRSPVPPRRDGVPPRPNAVYARQNNLDDVSDQFNEMPDSEVNIVKKVKVMMGRGQELENTEGGAPAQATAATKPDEGSAAGVASVEPAPQHYLVAAAVIEDESPLVRPYNDDVLKLIIRLPVEGQTQNVQFDFHLIEDDPVQVAKEMVEELGIPQDAVLEISATISGHARNARMKQEKHSNRLKWQQEQQQQQQMAQNVQGQQPQQPGAVQQQQPHQMNHNTPVQAAPTQVAATGGYGMSQPQKPPAPGGAAGGFPQQHPQAPSQGQVDEAQLPSPPQQVLSSRSLSGGQGQQPVYTQATTTGPQDGYPSQGVPIQQAQQQHVMQQPQTTAPQAQPPVQKQLSAQQVPMQQQVPVQQAQVPMQQHVQAPPVSREAPYQGGSQAQYAPNPSQARQAQPPAQVPTPSQPEMSSTFVQPQAPSMAPSTAVPPPTDTSLGQVPTHDSQSGKPLMPVHENGGLDSSAPASRPLHPVESEPSSDTDGLETNDEDDEDEEAFKEEMRRLDEDFQKNMQRAQKVFDSRMDNLQRSKEEREAQHQKTLERHEKERAEFEKKLRQAEKEQNRRIQQLQREWDKKRESLAKHKGGKKKPDVPPMAAAPPPFDEKMSEMAQANAESLGTMVSSTSRERLVPPTHKKTPSMNNSESSQRSRSSSSTSLNGDSGSNSDHGVI